ncbi:MAG TPA: TIGR03086 family metal-binding protein [Acidimicrobiales bacterium]
MSSNGSTYLRAAHGFTNTLSIVKEGQWQNRTPCDEWNVTDLVEHVVATHHRVYTMADADGMEDFGPDLLLTAQWIYALRTFEGVLNDPDMSIQPVPTRDGKQPFSALIEGMLMIDTLCHTWDLARAIGGDERLDDAAVTVAHEKLIEFGPSIRNPSGFKDPVTPRHGADAQTLLLNFAGRVV